MRLKMAALVALVAIMGLDVPAQAAGLWVQIDNSVDNFTGKYNGVTKAYQARIYHGFLDGAVDGNPGAPLGHITCVDLFGHVPGNPAEYYVDVKVNDGTGWTTQHTGERDQLGRVAWLVNNYGDAPLTNQERHGLQVAVWAIAYAGHFEYVTGLSAAAKAAMDNYVSISEFETTGAFTWYDAGDDEQDMMDPSDPVPEPGSMLLLGTGLLGLGIARFRRKK